MKTPSLRAPRGLKAARPNPRDERLELRAERLIADHALIPLEGPLLVGVSGGPDSVALLDFLVGYRARAGIPAGEIIAAHVNHGLRGEESEEDQRFVEHLAAKLGVRFMTARVDISKLRAGGDSVETASRTLRYRAFRRLTAAAHASQGGDTAGALRVAFAHTADDQAETVLLGLIRGAGLTGLSGMRPLRKLHGLQVVRPLLTTTRAQVLDYLKRRGLDSRLDSSNLSTDPRRNFIRLEILPRLESLNPRIRETLLREATRFREVDAYLSAEAAEALPALYRAREPGKIELDAEGLTRYPVLLRKYILRCVLQELNGEVLDLSTAHIDALHSLLTSPSGRSTDVPMGIRARRERRALVLRKHEREPDRAQRPSNT
jgi:tRNA(Ile)-lysidine synthase